MPLDSTGIAFARYMDRAEVITEFRAQNKPSTYQRNQRQLRAERELARERAAREVRP
jgi:hypothetical protein